jgi:hypothetical protein
MTNPEKQVDEVSFKGDDVDK